jgi:hypothetical protein
LSTYGWHSSGPGIEVGAGGKVYIVLDSEDDAVWIIVCVVILSWDA